VCGTSDFEIGWGYAKQLEIVDDRSSRRQLLRAERKPVSRRGYEMSQQWVRQAARRSALDA
jgi:hypothetical protein